MGFPERPLLWLMPMYQNCIHHHWTFFSPCFKLLENTWKVVIHSQSVILTVSGTGTCHNLLTVIYVYNKSKCKQLSANTGVEQRTGLPWKINQIPIYRLWSRVPRRMHLSKKEHSLFKLNPSNVAKIKSFIKMITNFNLEVPPSVINTTILGWFFTI